MDPYCLTMTDDVKLIFWTKIRHLGQKELLVQISDFLLQAIITWPNKIKLFISKPLKCTQEVLKQDLCVQSILLRGLLSLKNRRCKVIL